jgi:hypothetical protein
MDDFYPVHPGAKGLTGATFSTSADAADAIAPCVKYLQRVALRALATLGSATVLECVAITDYPRESLQPRYSELIAQDMVVPTGARKRNPSGKTAAVLTLTEKAHARLAGGEA